MALTEQQIEKKRDLLDSFSATIKKAKNIFAENFYKDYTTEDRIKMSLAERQQLQEKFDAEWKIIEDSLYKLA